MKKSQFIILPSLLVFLLIIIPILYFKFLAWPEVDESTKRADCLQAIQSVEFQEAVFAQAKNINALNELLSKNSGEILLFNRQEINPIKNPKRKTKIDLQLNDLAINLPEPVATSTDSILNLIDKEMIVGLSVYSDGSLRYSILDSVMVYKPRNYRVFHNLFYKQTIETVSTMGPKLNSLIKDTLSQKLPYTQYTIKIEPYMGW